MFFSGETSSASDRECSQTERAQGKSGHTAETTHSYDGAGVSSSVAPTDGCHRPPPESWRGARGLYCWEWPLCKHNLEILMYGVSQFPG